MHRLFLFALLFFATQTLEAAQTPTGAIKEGNRAGTIPAWTGGITKPPRGYQKGKHHVDPFAKDKVLFTISAANVEKYKKNLTAMHYNMIKRYPRTYKMNIYKSRRSCSLPQSVYRAIEKNAKTARLTNGGSGVEGATIATPFPNSKNPVELYWNHNFSYQGLAHSDRVFSAAVYPNGSYVPIIKKQKKLFYYANPKTAKSRMAKNDHFEWFAEFVAPPRVAGQMFSFTNTIDQVKEFRRGFVYNVERRRTARVPGSSAAYDSPMGSYGGLRISDDLFLYNGSPDKYNWKLVGKKEIYIPYNVYQATSVPSKKLIQARHLNQQFIRYELHRVWVIEATLKKGERHLYPRRVFYADEDSGIFTATDIYDKSNKLFRGQVGFIKNYYEEPACLQDFDVIYYFDQDYYLVDNVKNDFAPTNISAKVKEKEFGAQTLRRIAR